MLNKLLNPSIWNLLEELKQKDLYSFQHSCRVGYLCQLLAREMELKPLQQDMAYLVGLGHDVGKAGISDSILKKEHRLTSEEFDQMKQHAVLSVKLFEGVTENPVILDAIRYHHERYDGRGYCEGLKGESIPLYSRMILIADTFDALTSHRPYREALSMTEVKEELTNSASTQLDPKLTSIFLQLAEREFPQDYTEQSLNDFLFPERKAA